MSLPISERPAGLRPASQLSRAAYPRCRRGRPFRVGAGWRCERAASLARRPQDPVLSASGKTAPVKTCVRHHGRGLLNCGPLLCWEGQRIHAVGVGALFVCSLAGSASWPPVWLSGTRTLFGPPVERRPRCPSESATFGETGRIAAPPFARQGGVFKQSAWTPHSCGCPPAAREGRHHSSGGPRTPFWPPLDSQPGCKPDSATFGKAGWMVARFSAVQVRVSTPPAWAPLLC